MDAGRSGLRLAAVGVAAYGAMALAGRALTRRTEAMDLQAAPRPGRVATVDGAALHFVEAGSGPAAALLLPSFGGSTFSFRETVPALAPRFRTLALDLPGFGYSDRSPRADFSLAGYADRVARFMQQEDLPPALVIGHSMGGAVAMRLAIDYPELVERLVLIATLDPDAFRRRARVLRLARPILPLLGVLAPAQRSLLRFTLRRVVADPTYVGPPVIAGYERPMRVRGSARALRAVVAAHAAAAPPDPARLRVPTLLLWGEVDRVVALRVGERLLERIPDARLEVVPDAGHLVLEERPAAANAVLLRWLEETDRAARVRAPDRLS